MNDNGTMEQERTANAVLPEKQRRGRPQKTTSATFPASAPGIRDDDHAEEIVRSVSTYLSAGVRPMRILAECESGISGEQLETLLAQRHLDPARVFGRWWNHPKTIAHLVALEKWVSDENARLEGTDDYAETGVFRRVYGLLGAAHKARSLVAVTGLYGIGKTFAARKYVLDHPRGANEAGAVLFEFTPATRGDAGVLDAILNALEPHTPIKGTANAKLDRILSVVKPGDFLIADECGIPAEKGTGLRFMSYINEQAGVPVAMIGNPAFHAAVWGKRTDYDALASRTRHVSLGGNEAEDVDAFMSWKGLVGRRWKDALMTVARLPGRDGGLRGVVMVLDDMSRRDMEQSPDSFLSLAKSFGRMGA